MLPPPEALEPLVPAKATRRRWIEQFQPRLPGGPGANSSSQGYPEALEPPVPAKANRRRFSDQFKPRPPGGLGTTSSSQGYPDSQERTDPAEATRKPWSEQFQQYLGLEYCSSENIGFFRNENCSLKITQGTIISRVDLLLSLLLLLLLLKKIGNARPGEGDCHPISPKTPAPHYQPMEEKKRKGK